MRDTIKMIENKIVPFKNICKIASEYFFKGVITFLLLVKNVFTKNQKFNFPDKIYEIGKNVMKQNSSF